MYLNDPLGNKLDNYVGRWREPHQAKLEINAAWKVV